MPKTTTSLETPLRAQLDRLATLEPVDLPVISLYLDMQPNEHGRDEFRTFVRKVLGERQRTYANGSPARQSFDADVDRINTFLDENVERSANGLAIFACHGSGLFETMQMNAAIDDHWLFVGPVPISTRSRASPTAIPDTRRCSSTRIPRACSSSAWGRPSRSRR